MKFITLTRSAALVAAYALCMAQSAHAGTLYKCTSNGSITYANEPCKGQSMQIVKSGDGNMVSVHGAVGASSDDGSSNTNNNASSSTNNGSGADSVPDMPVVKLHPKADKTVRSFSDGSSSTNDRFLSQLQAQTQELKNSNDAAASPATAASSTASASALAAAPPAAASAAASAASAAMPNPEDWMKQTRGIFTRDWWPALQTWGWHTASLALLGLLLVLALGLCALYWVVKCAVKNGIQAAYAQLSRGAGQAAWPAQPVAAKKPAPMPIEPH